MSVKIVLLEDDQLVARALARVLRMMGHDVLAARTVDEAKAHVAAHADLRLAISDLGLQNSESGMDFLTWLEEQHPHVGRILLTGLTQPVAYPNDPPRQAFLAKPFNTDRLRSLLDEMTNIGGTT